MRFPIFWIHGDEGEHIDGRLEHIEFSVSSEVMKTISGIAALHILPEGLSKTVGTSFVSVARGALFICPHKDTVVIFAYCRYWVRGNGYLCDGEDSTADWTNEDPG